MGRRQRLHTLSERLRRRSRRRCRVSSHRCRRAAKNPDRVAGAGKRRLCRGPPDPVALDRPAARGGGCSETVRNYTRCGLPVIAFGKPGSTLSRKSPAGSRRNARRHAPKTNGGLWLRRCWPNKKRATVEEAVPLRLIHFGDTTTKLMESNIIYVNRTEQSRASTGRATHTHFVFSSYPGSRPPNARSGSKARAKPGPARTAGSSRCARPVRSWSARTRSTRAARTMPILSTIG